MLGQSGGLDQLLHGSSGLHGWGSAPIVDGTLYTVRGFDPATQRFVYQVNPRFGSTNPTFNTLRTPFRMTLDHSHVIFKIHNPFLGPETPLSDKRLWFDPATYP